jgi:predicted regulator of Ras-like GTPase activity (Roadblock/LC7/MglB family)
MRDFRGLWRSAGPRSARTPPARTPSALFSQADHFRRHGRYAEAAQMVARGLMIDPVSVTGHLLAAYLHVARRTIEPAKREFRWVLSRDPAHPRALLGLARIGLEEGDIDGCRDALVRALRAYPDFPEAQALLDGLATHSRPAPAAAPAAGPRLDRLRMPGTARALFVVGADGAVMTARPATATDLAERLARALGLATAAFRRAGMGPLRRGIVEDADDRHFVRADATLTLALTLPRATQLTQGLLEVNRLWAAAQHELAVARDDAAETGSARRVS